MQSIMGNSSIFTLTRQICYSVSFAITEIRLHFYLVSLTLLICCYIASYVLLYFNRHQGYSLLVHSSSMLKPTFEYHSVPPPVDAVAMLHVFKILSLVGISTDRLPKAFSFHIVLFKISFIICSIVPNILALAVEHAIEIISFKGIAV